MVSKKRKPAVEHKKATVKKHRSHKVLEKKVLKGEQSQKQEIEEKGVPSEPQAPAVPLEPTMPAESTNPLGSPVVASSGVLPESPKDQESQPEPQAQSQPPQPQGQQSQPQLSQQAEDTVTPQPDSATIKSPREEVVTDKVELEGSTTHDSLATSGVIRDAGEKESEEKQTTDNTDEPKKKNLWIIIAIIIIVLVFIGGGLWYFRENVLKRVPIGNEITPTPGVLQNTPTPVATDSADLVINLSEYKIKVLNGSGIAGEAARVRGILEDEEFNVGEIGNADGSDYEGTIIMAKKEVPEEFLDKLKEVLEESFILDASEELDDSEEVDVIIIVGRERQP